MKLYTIVCFGLILLGNLSCTNTEELEKRIDHLEEENKLLKNDLSISQQVNLEGSGTQEFDSLSYEEIRKVILDIEKNIEEITETEEQIEKIQNDPENAAQQDELEQHLLRIQELMKVNKKNYLSLKASLKNSKNELNNSESEKESLEESINTLQGELKTKEKNIQVLNNELFSVNRDVIVLEEVVEETYTTSQKLFEETNQAFILISDKEDLLNKDIIKEEGGFMGMGSVLRMNPDFDPNHFDEIEKANTEEIFIEGGELSVLSAHPSESYVLQSSTLKIVDAHKFWRQSSFLVISIE